DVAVVRIARNDADRAGLPAAGDANERGIRDVVTQVQAAARIPAAGVTMAVGAGSADRGSGGVANIAPGARKGRRQVRRRSRKVGELLITSSRQRAECDKKNDPERMAIAGFEHGGTQLQVKGRAPACKAGSESTGAEFC